MILLGLAVARVAVSVAMFVIVPLVLVLLSFLFGRALREAAQRVRSAGARAYDALDRAAEREQVEPDAARLRVEPVEDEHLRVSDERADDDAWDDENETNVRESRRDRR